MPAWGTGIAWQQEVLDPRNDRMLKVSRAQLQCIASLWGQDNQPPKEKDRESVPCLCGSSPLVANPPTVPDPRAGTEGDPGARVALHSSSIAAVFLRQGSHIS